MLLELLCLDPSPSFGRVPDTVAGTPRLVRFLGTGSTTIGDKTWSSSGGEGIRKPCREAAMSLEIE